MSFEQEKMIVGSLPSLYSLQKFEEEAVNVLASLQIDDDTISRKAVTGVLDRYMERLCSHINTPNDTESYSYARGLLVGVINNIKQLPPAKPAIVPCNYVEACNVATMDKSISAYTYLSVLADLKDHGFVLVDMREVTE